MKDDFSNDSRKELLPEGWIALEIVSMVEGVSKAGNPKYTIRFACADDPQSGIDQDLTNIPGKRWMLRSLLESAGIEPEKNEEGKEIYDWEIEDILGHTVLAEIIHDKTPFIGRDGKEIVIPKAKINAFKMITV